MTDFYTPLHGQHTPYSEILSRFWSWMLLSEEFIMSEDSPCIAVQRTPAFVCSLGVLAAH